MACELHCIGVRMGATWEMTMEHAYLASQALNDRQGEDRRKLAASVLREPYPLSLRATALVTQLSGLVNLRELRNEYPEMLDLLARHWNDSHALARTFDQLLFGASGGVPKLSLPALLELTALRQQVSDRLPRLRRSVWDDAFDAVV